MNVLKIIAAVLAAEAVFVALWIAFHGGLKDDATLAAGVAADAAELRSQLTSEERFAQQAGEQR